MNDFRSRVEGERPYLLRYASLQLRDSHAAEDAVQETLVAALAGEASFAGRSNLRTWLTGILKHKIVDAIRRMSREAPRRDRGGASTRCSTSAGTGSIRPRAWADPDAALDERVGSGGPGALPRRRLRGRLPRGDRSDGDDR